MSTSLTESGTGSVGFTFGERVSALFVVLAGGLSAISIVMLIGYKAVRIVRRARAGGKVWEEDAADSSLFLTLMLGEILRAIGKIMAIKWIVIGSIEAPTMFCTAQGVIQLVGTNVIDWCTLAITVQTTVVLIAKRKTPQAFAKYLALCVGVIISLIVGLTLGVRGLGIIGPAGFWCWIQSSYRAEQIVAEYLWMWMILILTAIAYAINGLVVRGFITVDGWRISWVSRSRVSVNLTDAQVLEEKERKELAMQLYFYPLVYFISVTPFSVTRWLTFSGYKLPHELTAFTSALFSLSGLFNVVLFLLTRPALITGGNSSEPEDGILPGPDTAAVFPPPDQDGARYDPVNMQESSTAGLLLAQRGLGEKHPEEDTFVEINYPSVRQYLPQTHRQASQSPTKYSDDEGMDDFVQLPP